MNNPFVPFFLLVKVKMKSKKYLPYFVRIFYAILFLSFSSINSGNAANSEVTGQIAYLLKHDEGIYPEYPYIGIGLVNISVLGSCSLFRGVTYFAIHDKDQKAIALSAYMADRQVEIVWDDTQKNSAGICKVVRINLVN